MRTTVNLDEDVLLAVHDQAQRERRTAGAVLSDLARQALTADPRDATQRSEGVAGFIPLPHRGAIISNALINQLREEEGV